MSHILDTQRLIDGVVCDTANDILIALQKIRSSGEDIFFSSLRNAIDNYDVDLICGHIDWLRAKFGDICMNSSERIDVDDFYQDFIKNNQFSSDERAHKFISEAYDRFV